MKEFKKIEGFSLYEISSNGIIRKVMTKEIVSQRVHPKDGLIMCDLRDDNLVARTVYPHKEVAKAFVPTKKKGKLLAIHKNGNKMDNRAENLMWLSQSEYQTLQVKRGTRKVLGNPELYKYSKFWQESNKKKKKAAAAVLTIDKKADKKANKTEIAKTAKKGRPAKIKAEVKIEKAVVKSKATKLVKGKKAKQAIQKPVVAIVKGKKGKAVAVAMEKIQKSASPAKRRGRPSKVNKAVAAKPEIKQAKGKKIEAKAVATPLKKRGRPAKVEVKAEVKTIVKGKKGRPAKIVKPIAVKVNKKPKAKISVKAVKKAVVKRGRPAMVQAKEVKVAAQPVKGKRGRPVIIAKPVSVKENKKPEVKSTAKEVKKVVSKRGRPATIAKNKKVAKPAPAKINKSKSTAKSSKPAVAIKKVATKSAPKEIKAAVIKGKRGRPAKKAEVKPVATKKAEPKKAEPKKAFKGSKTKLKITAKPVAKKAKKAVVKKETKAAIQPVVKTTVKEQKAKTAKVSAKATAKVATKTVNKPVAPKKVEAKKGEKTAQAAPQIEKPKEAMIKSESKKDDNKIVNLFKTPEFKEKEGKKRKRIAAKKVFTAKKGN